MVEPSVVALVATPEVV